LGRFARENCALTIKAFLGKADKQDGVFIMVNDRREKPRMTVCLDATWDGAMGNSFARVTDLSETGCYVDSMNETLNGEILRLKVKLSDGDWLELAGEVAHSTNQVGFGLRFSTLDELQLNKLHLFLEQLRTSGEEQHATLERSQRNHEQ